MMFRKVGDATDGYRCRQRLENVIFFREKFFRMFLPMLKYGDVLVAVMMARDVINLNCTEFLVEFTEFARHREFFRSYDAGTSFFPSCSNWNATSDDTSFSCCRMPISDVDKINTARRSINVERYLDVSLYGWYTGFVNVLYSKSSKSTISSQMYLDHSCSFILSLFSDLVAAICLYNALPHEGCNELQPKFHGFIATYSMVQRRV